MKTLVGQLAAILLELSLATATGGQSLNVCHDTPLGDFPPGSDITAPLQWAIDNQGKGEGFRPVIPRGKYTYSRTLRIPPGEGGYLGGMGRASHSLANARLVTLLKWTGPQDAPSLVYRGDNWHIENLAFVGRGVTDMRKQARRPAVGMLVTMQRGDPATTALRATNVAWWGWETGVQNGENARTSNCDMHVFTDCVFGDCDIGYRNVNHMGMHLTFVRPRGLQSNQMIRFEAGGHAYIDDAGIGGSTPNGKLLVLALAEKWPSGKSGFVVHRCKLDGSLNGTTDSQVVYCEQPYHGRLLLDHVITSNPKYAPNGGKLCTLQGRVQCTLRDCTNPGAVAWRGNKNVRQPLVCENTAVPKSIEETR